MLHIDISLPHIKAARLHHEKHITCYIRRKFYGATSTCKNAGCVICSSRLMKISRITPHLKSVLNQLPLNRIAGSMPDELKRIQNKFNKLYLTGNRKKISEADARTLGKIFDYNWFTQKEKNALYNAYDLCHNLKIESCIYCNRLYTSTVINEKKGTKIIRPTLDHWFSKEKHPLLTVSFYNLIPSCSPCNSSVKHTADFSLKDHIHPYIDKNICSKYRLKYHYNKSLNDFTVTVDTSEQKIKKTFKELYIAEIYSHHQSEIADLDLLRRKYNKQHLTDLGKLLNKTITEKDVYRILFGVEYDEENFHKRPLSKLKKDILDLKLK